MRKEKHLVLIATIVTESIHNEVLKNALMELVEPTRNEKGCLRYELVQSTDDNNKFYMLETWDSYNSWKEHRLSQHIKDFSKKAEGLVTKFIVEELYSEVG